MAVNFTRKLEVASNKYASKEKELKQYSEFKQNEI